MVAMIGLLTPDGILIQANRTSLAAANLSIEDVKDKPFEECYWWAWSKEVQKRLRAAIQEAAAGQMVRYDEVIRVGEDRFRTIDFMLSPLVENGRITYLIHSATDISERKDAEQALREVTAELEQKVVVRTAQLAARSKQLQSLAVELIEAEEAERKRIAQLLHDDLQQMLASAKMQLNAACAEFPTHPLLANVEKLLEDTIAKSRGLSHELSPAVLHHSGLFSGLKWLTQQMHKQFELKVEIENEIDEYYDHLELKGFVFRAIQELLFNVVKHAGVKQARVALRKTDQRLVVSVSDKGCGFNLTHLDSSPAKTGFGLLSLRERASYIGGELIIESALGHGSRFALVIPLSEPPTEAESPRAMRIEADEKGHQSLSKPKNLRVIFADDHKVMRQGLIRLFENQPNIQVVGEAANGREAIELARQLDPDVIVMDISMPEMDGIEATRHIKTEMPHVRVIVLSMIKEEHLKEIIQEAGAEAYLSKSVSSAELLEAIYGIAREKKNAATAA
jgi:PAS domain S-box-containing protein